MTGSSPQGRWKRLIANPWVVAGSILAGIVVGETAPRLALELGVIGDIYLDLLKMVVLPFMVAAIIFSLRKLLADDNCAAILPRLLVTFFCTFLGVALVGLAAGLLVAPGSNLAPRTLMAMGRLAGGEAFSHDAITLSGAAAAQPAQSVGDIVLSLIPTNIFSALTRGETLKVLAFSLLFGLAAGKTPHASALAFTHTLETVYQACQTLTRWFNQALPVVLFAIVASQIAKTGLGPLTAMVKFLVALGLGSLTVVLLSLLVLRLFSRRSWKEVLRGQRDPLLMALATRNGAACMPTMISALADQGYLRSRIELLVPLGISLLRVGPVLYYVVSTVFIAQLYHVTLGAGQLGIVVVGSILAGIASSGMSGLLVIPLTGMVCNFLGLPFEEAMALFIAINPLCDMLRALSAVSGSTVFAVITAGRPEPVETGQAPEEQSIEQSYEEVLS